MYSISNMIIQSALNKFGTDTVAAWAAYGKLDAIVWMVSGAFGIAITTFVGQNYGAGKYDRVRKSIRVCIGMDFAAAILLMLVLVCFRIPLFHIFVTDENVVEIGLKMMATMAPFYWLFVFTEVFSGALRGMGDVVVPMLITTGGICLFRVVWIFGVVALFPTLTVTLLNYPVSWVLTSVLFLFYYHFRMNRSFYPCSFISMFLFYDPYALSTLSDRKHEVHTYIFFVPPFTLTRTDLMLDFHILLDLL